MKITQFYQKYQDLAGKMLLAIHYFYFSASILLFCWWISLILTYFWCLVCSREPPTDTSATTKTYQCPNGHQQFIARTCRVSFLIKDSAASIDIHSFVNLSFWEMLEVTDWINKAGRKKVGFQREIYNIRLWYLITT